jgi:hypothetical protein
MEARTLGPFLPTNKRPSTAATNESEFFIHRISRAPQPQQPCTAEQFVGRAAKKQASEPPAETHWGKKNKGWVGQAQAWLASTHTKKTSVTSRQATNNVPTKHQTRSPRDTARSPTTLQKKPNQPEPKKKTPAINDPTAGSPTVTLLRLLLPLNDKVQ